MLSDRDWETKKKKEPEKTQYVVFESSQNLIEQKNAIDSTNDEIKYLRRLLEIRDSEIDLLKDLIYNRAHRSGSNARQQNSTGLS